MERISIIKYAATLTIVSFTIGKIYLHYKKNKKEC